MLKKALYLQLFWSSHTHILLKGNCYCTLLEQYHERAHCLRLTMPLVCVCVCVCVFFTPYRVKTKKFFATGSLPRFVYGSFQTDPSKEYFENRYPTRTPLKSQAHFAKKKTRKIVMNNSRSRLLNRFLIIVMVHLNPLSSFIFSTISSLKASATAVLIGNPLQAKSMAGWTRSFQGNLPYSLHARNWP